MKIDKTDINIKSVKENDFKTVITVVFSGLPHNIMIDSAVKTSLADEYMLNVDGDLEIVKKYKNAGIPKVFIKAVHPTNQKCSNLLLKKNIELKKIIHDNNVPCDNYSINVTMRKAIWEYYSDSLDFREVEIDVTKEDAKKIWDKLSTYLPVYSLFQADRRNSDDDIPINKRGSGVRRLVLLNFFRAEVERRFEECDNTGVIYAIEEPETSQHSDNQIKLINALKTLSSMDNVQVIITTHSGMIVKQLNYLDLRLITNTETGKVVQTIKPGQLKYPSLNEVNFVAFGVVRYIDKKRRYYRCIANL